MLGALLAFFAGGRFEDLIRHFLVPLPLSASASAAFVSFFSAISQGLAAAVASFSIYALSVSLQKHKQVEGEGERQGDETAAQSRAPLAPLLLRSRVPGSILGSVALVVVVVAYMLKQGTDVRHFYLIGMSLLGLAAMAVIAAVAFAVVLGPASKSTRRQPQGNVGIRIGVCVLHAGGVAAFICGAAVLLSYALSIFR